MKIRGLRILILCDKRDVFEGIETYLAHKGAYVQVTRSVEKFLSALKSFNPNYTIISIDVDDVFVGQLMTLMNESRGPFCIPTAETQDIETSVRLDELGIEHTFFPPLTGKKLENIIKFLETKKEKSSDKESLDTSNLEVNHSSANDFEKLFTELTECYEEFKTVRGINTEPSEIEILQKAIQFESGVEVVEGGLSGSDLESHLVTGENQKEEVSEQEEESAQTTQLAKDIWHLFDETVHAIGNATSVEHPERLKTISEFTVYAVSSSELNGYILTTHSGKNDEASQDKVSEIEGRLVQSLTGTIDGVFELQRLKLSFDQFDFQSWVHSSEGVLMSFKVGDLIVSWAFLDREQQQLSVRESGDENMVGVDLEEINPEVRVRNDMYLHMPRNNKFLLYTRKGNNVLGNQFEKLNNLNVNELHIKKEDIDKFKDYKVEKDISEMVKGHKKSA